MNKFSFDKSKPKISIFLPIFNKGKYLFRSISSIQKQSLKNLEIIAINDGSTDNSLLILKELAHKDSRIKIINNYKNRGSLFSRAMGILYSKGEYLMNLDPDDELNGKKSLQYLFNKAKRYNVDVIFFGMLFLPNKNKINIYSSYNRIIKQPELFNIAFKNNLLIDYYITNKLIKKELYEKSYNLLKKEIYRNFWHYYEDNIWSILIHKYANSSIFVNTIIYYYHINKDSAMKNRYNILEIKNLIYKYDMYKDIFNKRNEEKYVIAEFIELYRNFKEFIYIFKNNTEIKKIMIKKIEEFNNKYKISENILKNEFLLRI